jgi:hypothetical protein
MDEQKIREIRSSAVFNTEDAEDAESMLSGTDKLY